jgi:mannose-1-phosphate guanylyltransferase
MKRVGESGGGRSDRPYRAVGVAARGAAEERAVQAAPCTQAVVLVGGEGTRLRPITSRLPKPVAPLVCRPFIGYVLENLARHGVQRVVFSSGYLAEVIEKTVGDGSRFGLRVSYAVEGQPLGTAGAIKNAESQLAPERFFALNGDVLCDVNLTELAAKHVAAGAVATIYLTPVEDPRRYGLVRLRPNDSVSEFLEKPGEFDGPALINAGVYVLEPSVLAMIPSGQMFSIERGVFPELARAGTLFGHATADYWRDIGTPESYLGAHFDILEQRVGMAVIEQMGPDYLYVSPNAVVEPGARVVPPAYVDDGAAISASAQVGPLAVVGAGSRIGAGAHVSESVLQENVRVAADARVLHSVVVRDSSIGAGSELEQAILGEGCQIGAGNRLMKGVSLSPGTVLPDGSVTFRDLGDGEEGR